MPVTLSHELIGGLIGFLLTLMILSYLIGDNPFFRVAVYIFIGVSAGYAAAVALRQVLGARVFTPLLYGGFSERVIALIGLIMGVLLLMKISPRTARLGNPIVAYMVGVAAAVSIGGAILGTLIPQTQASITAMDVTRAGDNFLEQFVYGIFMLIGTVTTLVYFHFGAKATPAGPQRNKFVTILASIGQVFIAITLGVLFAGVFSASLSALIGRISSISDFFIKIQTLFL
jgi:hypothetical protein